MTFVITQSCCSDASCLPVCPVSCIRPTPDDPDFLLAEMLYIDPGTCIDCGACTDACPVGAIQHEEDLPEEFARYATINAAYFERHPIPAGEVLPTPPPAPAIARPEQPWRVAVVGAGPAGMFAAGELLARFPKGGVEVEVFDRLPTPWGLARAGVAPDHWGTKEISEVFRKIAAKPGFRFHLGVEVGRDLAHEDLLAHHDAVVYATGALEDRPLGLEGEELPGSVAAAEFVAWYNGHPDFVDRTFDLSGERAVVVGNGNVALDVARILLSPPDDLATTDIADHALAALRESRIREVVVLGRRGVDEAAYSNPELIALGRLAGVEVVVDPDDLTAPIADAAAASSFTGELRRRVLGEYAARASTGAPTKGRRRIVLQHLTSPVRIVGEDRVEGVETVRNELTMSPDGRVLAASTAEASRLDASLVVRSVGFRAKAVPGVEFDEHAGRFPHQDGRVVDPTTGNPISCVYTAGWAKRGPSGVIGTNRSCARETVEALVEDVLSGALQQRGSRGQDLVDLVTVRQPAVVDRAGWLQIEAAERAAGQVQGRPRVKITEVAEMVGIARRSR